MLIGLISETKKIQNDNWQWFSAGNCNDSNPKSTKSEKNSQSQKTVTRSVKLTRKQHLCAATPGVVDACVGDSGGPLDCWDRKRERQTIAGVVSFGKNCASETYAGVYTNVPFYATWIR